MTSVEARPEVEAEVVDTPETKPDEDKKESATTRRIVVSAVVALAVIIAGYAVFAAFEGPIASSWYNRRQAGLASSMAGDGKHSGYGNAIAIVQIPRLKVNVVAAEGDTPEQLRSGPAHREGTPEPGAIGNSVILGHNTGWGGPFSKLDQLKKDDLIVVQTPAKTVDDVPTNGVYKVISVDKVHGNDLKPFAQSTDRRITLITGTGGSYADSRLVVTAVSDTVGKVTTIPSDTKATTSGGSSLWNSEVLLMVIGLGVAGLLFWALRRRYSLAVVVTVVAPFALLGLLGLLLNIDAALPAVR